MSEMRYFRSAVSGEVYSLPESLACEGAPNGSVAVVVINPEDREQARHLAAVVERQIEAIPYEHTDYAAELTAAGQRALRSLLAPPKPPEPTGAGCGGRGRHRAAVGPVAGRAALLGQPRAQRTPLRRHRRRQGALRRRAVVITLGGPVTLTAADIDAAIDRVTAAPEWAVDAAVES